MENPTDLKKTSVGFTAKYLNELGLVVAVVVVIAFTIVFDPQHNYLKDPGTSARDILHQMSLLGIFALGAAIVIIAGGIDLSSGSVIVFCGSICSLVMLVLAPVGADGLPDASNVGIGVVLAAIAAAIFTGFMVGTVHAWLITVVRLPPFVATLASLVGLRSLAKILNQAVTAQLGNQQTKVRADDETFALLSQWWVALVVFFILGSLCWLLMNKTVVGRHLYALGGNEEAARLSGIRTDRLKWLAYSLGGVTSAIASILFVAKIGAANPSTLAVGYELNAIAAAVVGGCSLQGGVGFIPGVMLGVLFLRVVIDSVAKVVRAGSDDYEGLIVGFLVVLAVAFNELRRQTASSSKQFFPGAIGVVMIPILAMLVGTVLYIMKGAVVGGVIGGVTLALLIALKVFEEARKSRA